MICIGLGIKIRLVESLHLIPASLVQSKTPSGSFQYIPRHWMEIYSALEQRWIPVDCTQAAVDEKNKLEAKSSPHAFVLGCDQGRKNVVDGAFIRSHRRIHRGSDEKVRCRVRDQKLSFPQERRRMACKAHCTHQHARRQSLCDSTAGPRQSARCVRICSTRNTQDSLRHHKPSNNHAGQPAAEIRSLLPRD